MAEFASNCPISWPIRLPGIRADVDFGGFKFSYQHGLIFEPEEEPVPMRTPPMAR